VKIASFNANGIRARTPVLIKWIEKESPDVLCIQETKVQDQDFPRQPFEAYGYHCRFQGQQGFNGVAVLSKTKPSDVKTGFGDQDEKEGPRLITLKISRLTIINTYVPQGLMPGSENFKYKIDWFSRLRKYLEQNFNPEDPIVWAGDFNVAPEPMDVYDPESLLGNIGYHPEEHKALTNVMKWGFIDVYRLHNPHGKAFTFWDYRIRNAVKRGMGWRIDHICATQCISEKSKNAWIDITARILPKPSDHTFVIAEFDL
jgi:exodeoxyribonuclease-3